MRPRRLLPRCAGNSIPRCAPQWPGRASARRRNYLHRAFPYKTDEAQFGIERTLFAEEMYYYPYSDCEDRSILFARLVKDLLGLDVVLLYYPAHIAAAVCFKGEVKGDYMQLGNKRYVICDATYIGAGVGEAMPDLKRTPAQVVRID